MPSFKEHLIQVRSNWQALQLAFATECLDWQITICFYSAYHLLQAHFAKFGKHHVSHNEVKAATDPENKKSKTRLKADIFTAYEELQVLSRRARYLFDGKNPDRSKAYLIDETHAAAAIQHLNSIAVYFSKKYHLSFPKIMITHSQTAAKLKQSLDYFEIGGK